jgi:hypothetical protein
MAINSKHEITINGVTYRSKTQAEIALRMTTGTLSKRTRCLKPPFVFDHKGTKYEVSRP